MSVLIYKQRQRHPNKKDTPAADRNARKEGQCSRRETAYGATSISVLRLP